MAQFGITRLTEWRDEHTEKSSTCNYSRCLPTENTNMNYLLLEIAPPLDQEKMEEMII
jgi:hypothetical protein